MGFMWEEFCYSILRWRFRVCMYGWDAGRPGIVHNLREDSVLDLVAGMAELFPHWMLPKVNKGFRVEGGVRRVSCYNAITCLEIHV